VTAVVKKADLESAYARHIDHVRQAATAEADRDYREALRRAEASLQYLRDALIYQRRYQKISHPQVAATDLILRLAPPLFARRSLDALEAATQGRTKAERAAFTGEERGFAE